jgi:hypothetical protein
MSVKEPLGQGRIIMRKISLLLCFLLVGIAGNAFAVPSFARQTGMACEACHTSYPDLTSFGRYFKINGYTMTGIGQVESAGNDKTPGLRINQIPPLSMMLQTSLEWQRSSQVDTSATPPGSSQTAHTGSNFPLQLSFFFAGEISPNMGSMVQLTYSHQDDHFSIDNSDIRFADHATIAGSDMIYGITLNNNPTVEDPWQSTPAWGFPFLKPGILPSPAAAPILDGLFAQDTFGVGGYALWNQAWYGNITGYRSEHAGVATPYNAVVTNTIAGTAPYWRLAHQNNFGDSYLEIGTYGMDAHVIPVGIIGPSDDFLDTAIDAQYETSLTGGNSLVIRASYNHEQQNRLASVAAGTAATQHATLNTWHINGSYHLGGKQTFTLGYNQITGSSDTVLYAPAANTGSANGSPASTDWQLQYALMPWQNVQLGAQYTAYTKFNGGTSDYDGSGSKAHGNNVAMVYGWFMW